MGNTNDRLPETLYYYCSLETFLNIIENSSIWLTEIGKSNDSLEQKYLAMEIVNNLKMFVDIVGDKSITDNDIWELKNIYRNKIELLQPTPVWAICLSAKGDDLSQWRGYGNDGEGICIGFNTDYLRVINDLRNTSEFDFMRFREIEYGKEAINNYFSYLKQKPNPKHLNVYKLKEYLDKIIRGLLSVPYYKSAVFADEQEWRIIYSYDNLLEEYAYDFDELNKISTFAKNFEIMDKKYLVHKGYIKSYIELKIKRLIDSIDILYIGPKSKVSKQDIKRFLSDKIGFHDDFEIKYSKADSYR